MPGALGSGGVHETVAEELPAAETEALVLPEPLAELYLRDFLGAGPRADEALLTLADFLIMLREVEYQAAEGMLPKTEFGKTYQAFLSELAVKLREQVETRRALVSADMSRFWDRVVERCVS